MKRFVAIGALLAAWAADIPAEAMPLGVRMALWSIAAAQGQGGNALSDALDAQGLDFTTGGDSEWSAQGEAAHGGGSALKSGAICDNQETWVETSVNGAGVVSFWWKASSEHYRQYAIDYAMFSVDGQERLRIGGEQDWTNAVVTVDGTGTHVLRWTYVKDDEVSSGEDCAWLDEVTWTPTSGLEAWLAERHLAANAQAANGRTAAECYALGLDPTIATNDFRIVSFWMDGDSPMLEWEPKTNRWTGDEIKATLKGALNLHDKDWTKVTDENKALFRFFKVEVALP